jgi:YVTN family beta-propeller protein
MSDIQPPAPTQAALGKIRSGVVRNDIQENVQPDATGAIAPFSFQPPGGVSGWKRVRIANYTPYVFQVIGIPDGGSGDPPQLLQPFQENVWNYVASRGTITLIAAQDNSPLAVPPLQFAYGEGTAKDQLLYNFVTIEWTDTPDLFFGYYPVPLVGIAITAEAQSVVPIIPSIPVGASPLAVVTNPNTNRIYVANHGSNSISVIDGGSMSVIANIAIGHSPVDLAINPSVGLLYVATSDGSHLVIRIDTTTNTVVGSTNVGADQTGISVVPLPSFAPGGDKKYVSLAGGTHVAVIDGTQTLLVGAGYPVVVGNAPLGSDVNIGVATPQVYVANSTDGTVSQIDSVADTVAHTIAVGVLPTDVAVDPVTGQVWVVNATDHTVSEIDAATNAVTHTIGVGTDPIGVSADSVTGKVYTANNGANSVSVIDEATHLVVATLIPGVGPKDVAVDSATNKVYVPITANEVVVLNGV